MTEYPIHPRVFKVSNQRNPLDLQCEQHKRQIRHRDGLLDWQTPRTPAGKAARRHGTTPAFFAWDQETKESTWQTETPQKIARTLEMESEPEVAPEKSPYRYSSEERIESIREDEPDEEMASEVVYYDDTLCREEKQVMRGRCITVSPVREDILDRSPRPAASAVLSQHSALLPSAQVSSSPHRPKPSPRSRLGHQPEDNDATGTQLYVAGITTEQADRYRMNRSSGKRLRSPPKQTSLWEDRCNSNSHHSGASANVDTPSFSHKRQVCSAAERTFGGSSVFRTLNMDMYNRPQSDVVRGQRRHGLNGSGATYAANQALHEFFTGEREEESKQAKVSLQQVDARHRNVNRFCSVPSGAEAFGTPTAGPKNYRKTKKVSFDGNTCVNTPNEAAGYLQPRTLPVLADKTTQTDAFLLPNHIPTRSDRHEASDRREVLRNDHESPSCCSACDTTMAERPRKFFKGSTTDSVGAALPQQCTYRRTSSHLTNPIMINPRYQQETTTIELKPTHPTASTDRVPWR